MLNGNFYSNVTFLTLVMKLWEENYELYDMLGIE